MVPALDVIPAFSMIAWLDRMFFCSIWHRSEPVLFSEKGKTPETALPLHSTPFRGSTVPPVAPPLLLPFIIVCCIRTLAIATISSCWFTSLCSPPLFLNSFVPPLTRNQVPACRQCCSWESHNTITSSRHINALAGSEAFFHLFPGRAVTKMETEAFLHHLPCPLLSRMELVRFPFQGNTVSTSTGFPV